MRASAGWLARRSVSVHGRKARSARAEVTGAVRALRYTHPAMPTYEYVCKSCGHIFDIVQSMKDEPLTDVPSAAASCARCSRRPPSRSRARASTPPTTARSPSSPSSPGEKDSGESSSEGTGIEREGRTPAASQGPTSRAEKPARDRRLESEPGSRPDREPAQRLGIGKEGVMTTAEIGVFGGSGFYSFLETTETVDIDTPYGSPQRAARRSATSADGRVAFIPRHGLKHEFPPHRVPYQANVWAMKELGVTRVLGPERVRLAAGGREARRLRDLRPVGRPDARPAQHVLRRAGDHAHLVRRPVLPHDARRRRSRRDARSASRCTTAAPSW